MHNLKAISKELSELCIDHCKMIIGLKNPEVAVLCAVKDAHRKIIVLPTHVPNFKLVAALVPEICQPRVRPLCWWRSGDLVGGSTRSCDLVNFGQ